MVSDSLALSTECLAGSEEASVPGTPVRIVTLMHVTRARSFLWPARRSAVASCCSSAGTVGLAARLSACSQRPRRRTRPRSESLFRSPTVSGSGAHHCASRNAPGRAPQPVSDAATGGCVAAQIICREGWRALPATGPAAFRTPPAADASTTRASCSVTTATPRLDCGNISSSTRTTAAGSTSPTTSASTATATSTSYVIRWIKGDTATEYDTTGHFLVLCEGNFDEEDRHPRTAARRRLGLCVGCCQVPDQPDRGRRSSRFRRHSMPGRKPAVLRRVGRAHTPCHRADRRRPVDLQKICGPEAAERVAAIEAGG